MSHLIVSYYNLVPLLLSSSLSLLSLLLLLLLLLLSLGSGDLTVSRCSSSGYLLSSWPCLGGSEGTFPGRSSDSCSALSTEGSSWSFCSASSSRASSRFWKHTIYYLNIINIYYLHNKLFAVYFVMQSPGFVDMWLSVILPSFRLVLS